MNFISDNKTGASPRILTQSLPQISAWRPTSRNSGSREAARLLNDIFERDVAVFLVSTGTASNALALAALAPPGSGILCHEEAHVIDAECGAPEFFSGGAKVIGIPGDCGKITPEGLTEALAQYPRDVIRQVPPAALSLSQATESGTIYDSSEVAALTGIAHAAGLGVHMDGARFANALVELGAKPADVTWKVGVDILSFGATKNGALACEGVILFDKARAAEFSFRRKRSGHTLSKGRLLGSQMHAYLQDGHWLDLARSANRAAARLADGLARSRVVRCPWPRGANEVFAVLPSATASALREAGALFNDWSTRSLREQKRPGADEVFVRLVCSFQTTDDEIDRFLAIVRNQEDIQSRAVLRTTSSPPAAPASVRR